MFVIEWCDFVLSRVSNMAEKWMVLLLTVVTYLPVNADDYSLLFNDNYDAVVDHPLKFEYPLPKWLKGSLVSSNIYIYIDSVMK